MLHEMSIQRHTVSCHPFSPTYQYFCLYLKPASWSKLRCRVPLRTPCFSMNTASHLKAVGRQLLRNIYWRQRDKVGSAPPVKYCRPQSRQSAKLFLLSSELGLPQPLTRRRVCPPHLWFGGRVTLAGERGGGRVPVPTRGYTLWYSVNIRTLCCRLY